jgi:transcriptional regulator with XRE-family HTH domain
MNLKQLRESHVPPLKQKQLAELLKVRQSTVSMWESGNSSPRAGMLPDLAKILDCTVDKLLDKS